MLSLVNLAAWLGTLWGRVALGAGVVASLVALRALDVHHQRVLGEVLGEKRAVAKIEKENDNAVRIGKRAAERSTSGGVRGPVDPTTRD